MISIPRNASCILLTKVKHGATIGIMKKDEILQKINKLTENGGIIYSMEGGVYDYAVDSNGVESAARKASVAAYGYGKEIRGVLDEIVDLLNSE